MTGLTLALRLARDGQKVIVHEQDPYLGGLSSESTLGGIPIERFYHCILPTDFSLLRLIDDLGLNELTAITTVDGRYRDIVRELVPYTCEMGLIRARVEIEAKYIIALSEAGLVRPMTDQERKDIVRIGQTLTHAQSQRVKQIEKETHHDVESMKRTFREIVVGTSLVDVIEMIHWGLTSEDINNLAYRLQLMRAVRNVCIPALDELTDKFIEMAGGNVKTLMLARTHGQSAAPTLLSKEMLVFAMRLNREIRKLEQMQLTGKLNGAVGNDNARRYAAPEINWIEFSRKFVESLGFKPNMYTTQINPYEDMIEMFQAVQRVNGIILDLDQDVWRYISDFWMTLKFGKKDVGSSAMPQKVNPIDFENSEGNVTLANGIWDVMVRDLPVSRLQRDLSDSTVVRNTGLGLAFGLIGYKNTLKGLGKININVQYMRKATMDNWTILAEAAQIKLRRLGVEDAYPLISEATKGKRIHGPKQWKEMIRSLPIPESAMAELENLTPKKYIGYARELTETAIQEISASRKWNNIMRQEQPV